MSESEGKGTANYTIRQPNGSITSFTPAQWELFGQAYVENCAELMASGSQEQQAVHERLIALLPESVVQSETTSS